MTDDTVTIRAGAPEDVAPLHALVESAYRGDSARAGWTHEADLLGGQRTDQSELAAILADPNEQLLVAIEGTAIIGCVQVSRKDAETAYLGLLSVAPGRQAGGLGKRLMAAAEDAARELGARRIEMTVIHKRAELIAYYERRGYRLAGEERPFPFDAQRVGLTHTRDLDFVVLEKTL